MICDFTSHGYWEDFSLFQLVLSPIRELLVNTKVWEPLLHLKGYCAMLVIAVVWGHHGWVGLLDGSHLWSLACLFWYQES